MASSSASVDSLSPSPDALEAARLISGPLTRLDRWVDRLNPIFIKETRQAVKSRQFLFAFLLMLLVSWLISLIAVTAAGQGLDYGDWGRDLFSCYFVVLAAAILVVVPFTAFRSLMSEREEATFEPLIISTLTPRQIVLGKVLSALLQAFLFYSAIAPFMAFTALLQGFDIAHVALLLGLGLGASLWASVAALAISAMVQGRMWQTIVSLTVLAGLVVAFSIAWGMSFSTRWLNWSDPWTIAGLVSWIIAGLANIVLLQQIAVANLTFQADNRSTGLRVIIEGQFILIWLCITGSIQLLGGSYSTASQELHIVGLVLSLLLWSAAGLFFVTEVDGLSQRIVRRLPRSAVVRLLLAPFYPGGSRGLVLLLGNLLIIGMILGGTAWVYQLSFVDDEVVVTLACGMYLVIYLNVAAALARWALGWSAAIQPIHCRVGTLVLIALAMTAPMFLLLFDNFQPYNSFSLLYILNPAITFDHLSRNGSHMSEVSVILTVAALLSTAFNLPAMARGLYEMVAAEPLPPEALHP